MTEEQRKEYLDRLLELGEDTFDAENIPYEADGILCDILKLLGYNDIVSAYNEIKKWYAYF